jgi:hypothetical protein
MENLELNNNNQPANNMESKKMSFFQRALGIILSPSQTMRDLEEKPRILFPILLMALSMPVLYLLRLPLFQDTIRKTMEMAISQQSNAQVTTEQMDMMIKIGTITGLAGAPAGVLVMWLVYSAILFAIVKIFKGEGSFKQYCSITGYAYLITLLYLIVTLLASFFTNSIQLDSSLMILKDFIPADSMSVFMRGFILTILKAFDVFGIWHYIVVATGVAVVGKLPNKKAYMAVAILFVLATLFGALYAGITGAGKLM